MATAVVFILIAPAQASLLVAYVPSLTNPLPFGVAGFFVGENRASAFGLARGAHPCRPIDMASGPGLPVAGRLGRTLAPQ